MADRIIMVKHESKFILKCFNEERSADIAYKYIFELFDIGIGYRVFLRKIQIILFSISVNDNNELISSDSTEHVIKKKTEQFKNSLNRSLVTLTIIKN
jgi:hypothetical protein